jgi:hypothetical protein
MDSNVLGKPRPLWHVIGLSVMTGMLYYGWYKWIIQEELRRYTGHGWTGTLCLFPFVVGVLIPQVLRLGPNAPSGIGWLSFLGIAWIYIVQFRLYGDVNKLYAQEGLKTPLTVWWMFIPGLNLIVGLRQIHFLGQYWAEKRGLVVQDPIAKNISFLSTNA